MRVALALLLAAATLARPVGAQSPAASGGTSADPAGQTSDGGPGEPAVDASKLGVSMSRIRKGLRLSETREQRLDTPLRLEFQVQVYGTVPRIDIMENFDIGQGAPLSYGAPTHNEFLNQWTPQAYRSPPVPISSLAGWALFQLVKRSEKSKCEQAIAEYRALVMQGIPTSAPRCTQ
jgi:hypothetical protein